MPIIILLAEKGNDNKTHKSKEAGRMDKIYSNGSSKSNISMLATC